MGIFIDPKFGQRKGKIIKLTDKEPIGTVRNPVLEEDNIWFGFSTTKTGNRITRIMGEKEAHAWSEEKGKNIWKKMTVGDLRKL